jgi:hypothetical protein
LEGILVGSGLLINFVGVPSAGIGAVVEAAVFVEELEAVALCVDGVALAHGIQGDEPDLGFGMHIILGQVSGNQCADVGEPGAVHGVDDGVETVCQLVLARDGYGVGFSP